MTDAYREFEQLIRLLHAHALAGTDESPEADSLRDASDALWFRLTAAERRDLAEFSEALLVEEAILRATGAAPCP